MGRTAGQTHQLCKLSTLHQAMIAQVRKPFCLPPPGGTSMFLMQLQHTSCHGIKSIPRCCRQSRQPGCEIINVESIYFVQHKKKVLNCRLQPASRLFVTHRVETNAVRYDSAETYGAFMKVIIFSSLVETALEKVLITSSDSVARRCFHPASRLCAVCVRRCEEMCRQSMML